MIRRRGERGSGISVLAARHDDDECSSRMMTLVLNNLRRDVLPMARETKGLKNGT